jgi:hypothetical protein
MTKKKKTFEHPLLGITRKVEFDPYVVACMERMFIFANEMGLKGTKVSDLTYKEANNPDPSFRLGACFYCLIEVDDE